MKKLLSVVFALLLAVSMTGVALSHTITIDPSAADGSGTQVVPVYNNSGGTLDIGDVVVWDIGSSTGDNDFYVTTTTTANTGVVAGVVLNSTIAAASEGEIVIFGPATCDVGVGGIDNGGLLCSSTTAGSGKGCASTSGSGAYAIASADIAAGSSGACFVIAK